MTEFIVTTIDGKQFRARSENTRLSTVVDQLNSKGYPQPSGSPILSRVNMKSLGAAPWWHDWQRSANDVEDHEWHDRPY